MPPERKDPRPTMAELMAQVAASAMEPVLPQNVKDLLMTTKPEELAGATPGAEVVKGQAQPSVAWIHAPAQLEILVTADKRLTHVAELLGMSTRRVEKLSAKVIPNSKVLVLKPAGSEDMTAAQVNRYPRQSSAWINLIELLSEFSLTLETGYRERYEVNYIPQGSPLYPGLFIDLGDPKERKQEHLNKNKEDGSAV